MSSFIIQNGSNQEGSYTFPLEPENLNYSTAARTFQNQSRSALSIQRYGRGFTTISLSGTTGFRGGTGHHQDNGHGKQKAEELKTFLYNYMDLFSDDVNNEYKLLFMDNVNNRLSQVELQPNGFSIQQSINSPLMYTYNINLVIVGDPTKATSGEISNALLGNSQTAANNSQQAITPGQATYLDPRTMASSRIQAANSIDSNF